jgi:hypothetical protein
MSTKRRCISHLYSAADLAADGTNKISFTKSINVLIKFGLNLYLLGDEHGYEVSRSKHGDLL